METNRRLILDRNFREIGTRIHGTKFHLYYQPPESVKLEYPCIIYERDVIDSVHANNFPYKTDTRYSGTIISRDQDDPLISEIAKLPLCSFDRHYVMDNLYHDVFIIY